MRSKNSNLVVGMLLALFANASAQPAHAAPLDTWHWRNPLPSGNGLYRVAFGNGAFVAVGNGGEILSSADGTNWNPQVAGTPQNLYGLTYAQGIFLAVGAGGTVLASSNAVDWIAHGPAAAQDLRGVAFGNNMFVAVGSNGSILQSDPVN